MNIVRRQNLLTLWSSNPYISQHRYHCSSNVFSSTCWSFVTPVCGSSRCKRFLLASTAGGKAFLSYRHSDLVLAQKYKLHIRKHCSCALPPLFSTCMLLFHYSDSNVALAVDFYGRVNHVTVCVWSILLLDVPEQQYWASSKWQGLVIAWQSWVFTSSMVDWILHRFYTVCPSWHNPFCFVKLRQWSFSVLLRGTLTLKLKCQSKQPFNDTQ